MRKNLDSKVEYNKSRPNENGRSKSSSKKSSKKGNVVKSTKSKLAKNLRK